MSDSIDRETNYQSSETPEASESQPESNTESNTQSQTQSSPPNDTSFEEFRVSGDTLISKIQELVHQGNVRRVIVKTEDGKTLFEVPLTVGLAGATLGTLLFPPLAVVGALGAVVARLTLVVERQA
ncbi:DUF4342 domain-containing protein [Baaleninema sp.]|uniref:DUF4342 domain-containing protein n=1 Tax=Baaleninema sp. TaxID=3101197 RepID=UPI003D08DD82